jgi:hypothetical protein
MMHSNDFVVAILYNGSFLEESKGGVVALPFGAEYTIRLRNKKNRRAAAQVFIDEENVSKGGIIVPAHNFVDLECDVATLRKFKFVSAESGEAIDAGKNNKADDSNGVIRVEWRAEKEYKLPIFIEKPVPYPVPVDPYRRYYPLCTGGQSYGSMRRLANDEPKSLAEDVGACSFNGGEQVTASAMNFAARKFAEGCTVQGSESSQRFHEMWLDLEDTITAIRLTLRGYETTVPIQTQKKEHCENCGAGRKSKKAKFCWNCGKGLT